MAIQVVGFAVVALCGASAFGLLRRGLATTSAWLLLATAVLLAVHAAVPAPQRSAAPLFALSALAAPLMPACASVVGLFWPVRPLTPTERAAGTGALVLAGLIASVLPTVALDPSTAGCNQCPHNLLEVSAVTDQHDALARIAAAATILWGTTVAALTIRRWWRAPRLARRNTWPMLWGGAGVASVAAAAAAHSLTLHLDVFNPWTDRAWRAQLTLIALIALGSWFRLSLPRRTADRVARSVLSATPTPPALVASLAHAVGDPGLVVTYRRLDGQRIAATGLPVASPPDRAVLRLTRDGPTYAEVWYDTRRGADPDLVRAAVDSSGLALEYVAAHARLRAETLDSLAARRRVVTRGDAERRRLERDLHDGAQQSLIALSMKLTAISTATDEARSKADDAARARQLVRAQQEITLALQDLRTVAHGLFPVSLAEAGLGPALRELGDHTPVALVVEGSVNGGDPETAMAVYQLVADVASATPPADGAAVHVLLSGGGDGAARVRVTSALTDREGAQAVLLRAEDRVAALGGTISVAWSSSGLSVEGEIPCVS